MQIEEQVRLIYSIIFKDFDFESREIPVMMRKHAIRYYAYKEMDLSLKTIGFIEALVFGIVPTNHSTILNSLDAYYSLQGNLIISETLRHIRRIKEAFEKPSIDDLPDSIEDRIREIDRQIELLYTERIKLLEVVYQKKQETIKEAIT